MNNNLITRYSVWRKKHPAWDVTILMFFFILICALVQILCLDNCNMYAAKKIIKGHFVVFLFVMIPFWISIFCRWGNSDY